MNLIITSLEQGLIFAILAMGVLLTYKILNEADLSVEGSFPFGAFIFAKFVSMGLDPITSTILAFCLGTLAGLMTSTLFIRLKIKPILGGILTMTMLYSVNLRLNGKSNVPLFDHDTVFDLGPSLIVLVILVLAIKLLIDGFLKTERGYLLIATGDNEALVRSLGANSNKYKIMGFMLANGLISLSGALMAQYQGFADITMGAGVIVVALAAIIIGDTIKKKANWFKITSRAIVGAVIYKIMGGIALDLGLAPTDLKAISAIIVILFIAYNNLALNFIGSIRKKGEKSYAEGKKLIKNIQQGN